MLSRLESENESLLSRLDELDLRAREAEKRKEEEASDRIREQEEQVR